MCARTRTCVVREGAHDRAFIGEGDGKVGRNEKKVGEGGEGKGVGGAERKSREIGRWSRA